MPPPSSTFHAGLAAGSGRGGVALALALALAAVLGASGVSLGAAPCPSRSAAATPAAAPAALPPGTAALGESLLVNGLRVAVLEAERMGSYGYTYAAPARMLLVIEVEIANGGQSPRRVDPAAFRAVDPRASATWPPVAPVAIGLLEAGMLEPREAAAGRVVFEIPATADDLLIRFDPGLFDPAGGTWRIPGNVATPATPGAAALPTTPPGDGTAPAGVDATPHPCR